VGSETGPRANIARARGIRGAQSVREREGWGPHPSLSRTHGAQGKLRGQSVWDQAGSKGFEAARSDGEGVGSKVEGADSAHVRERRRSAVARSKGEGEESGEGSEAARDRGRGKYEGPRVCRSGRDGDPIPPSPAHMGPKRSPRKGADSGGTAR
jgi:hypothetical protein